ncbi:3-isopropylmalate dehydrogenase [Engelhardtia mirabilis]|uniref:3-isopropylmalate dehydrogenase n=1 Tax=Engelhardtia mirabilis TaxID=2528011 RepID=A0A518BHW5_9BACT|nr:D-malate dehydrogenase [decarboxylating] [Planctomycetes bacterium Pla133]QDV00882.1 D-malate dehydrogenase [decarboxylating] [Planctomycetes bacterium Pla86]
MKQYDIASIGGDGIGPEVTAQAMRILDAAAEQFGFSLKIQDYPLGTDYYLANNEIFPSSIFEECKQQHAIFLGAIGDPRVPVGMIEFGIIAKLRFELDLYINLRPVKLYDARLCPLKDKTPEDIDMLIVRENTEGAYSGMHGFAHKGQPLEVATQTMVYTREGVERAVRYAFELTKTRAERKVTLVDKANAIRAQDIWTRTFAEVAAEYPDVATDHAYVDAACMWMIKNPEWFDVIVTPNLFGDIITDLGASLQGGMGIAASGNIHPGQVSLFEPIHGSAPKHAGKNVASPVAAIMAASMLLDYVGEKEAGAAIETAIVDLVRDGSIRGVSTAMHRTDEVGDMVLERMRSTAGV